MSNIAKNGAGLPASIGNLKALASAVAENPSFGATGGSAYMKFLQEGAEGMWVYGVDQLEADPEGQWVIDPHSLRHGWVQWADGAARPDKIMVPATQPHPRAEDLPHNPEAQQLEARGLTMVAISGDDEGVQAEFETNSMGGRDAWAEVLHLIFHRVNSGHTDCYPVVELAYGKPYASRGKTIRKPRFVLVGWTDQNGTPSAEALEGPTDNAVTDPKPEAKPVRRRRRKA